MGYLTFEQQQVKHLQFLQEAGFEVASLIIDSPEFIRSRTTCEEGRGEYAYKTVSRMLNNGMIGLMTWRRSERGEVATYKTYGWSCNATNNEKYSSNTSSQIVHRQTTEGTISLDSDLERIRKFWELSSQNGISDYLIRKGVGSYRIRFRENQYGKVAVVPIVDIRGKLCGYQMLNSNGAKVFARGMQLNGAFHQLNMLTDDSPIGIAESYVTAAMCLEVTCMPMVTAFTSNNLEHVAMALQERYPKNPLVIFADNDAHLSENKGLISALNALERAKSGGLILTPKFRSGFSGSGYSDWNDLVHTSGRRCAIEQMVEGLHRTKDRKIKRFHTLLSELLNF
jgi:phage/plasmid primase-like uncharacterized protein